ncbi:MAG: hypothetical protein J7641_19845 [Cyanobacteria bacterium SID2]|nr:hypothetical protein [Cyanobacteria bacterium SID2]MBP0004212.1 hypothetical protein [Cyanobacteria bacterium SBC]
MSNQSGFTGGFIAGALFGGAIGGIVGALFVSRQASNASIDEDRRTLPEDRTKNKRLQPSEEMEVTRRNLENKIAQLNDTIDDVRQQLHTVNGGALDSSESSISREN